MLAHSLHTSLRTFPCRKYWPDQVEHHGLDAGLPQVFRAALRVVIQQVLHDGYGLLHKLGVSVIDRNLETGETKQVYISCEQTIYDTYKNIGYWPWEGWKKNMAQETKYE